MKLKHTLLSLSASLCLLLCLVPNVVQAVEPNSDKHVKQHERSDLATNVWLSFDDLKVLENPEYEPRFKLFSGAKATPINKEHIRLDEGEVLVRATTLPVFVSANVNGERIISRVARNTLAFISASHGSMRVMPLTETCCSALMLYVPGDGKRKQNAYALQSGKIGEVFVTGSEPLVAPLLTGQEVVRDFAGKKAEFVVAQCNEKEAVKSFGLVPYLKGSNETLSHAITEYVNSQ